MTQFWYGVAIGFTTGVFLTIIAIVLFLRFYNRASDDERKYDDDRFMDTVLTMKGRDDRTDEQTSVTLFIYVRECEHFIDWNFKNRTDMEKHIARDMEDTGCLSCEISYRKRDDGLFDVLVDGKYYGTADLRNDRTMNKPQGETE